MNAQLPASLKRLARSNPVPSQLDGVHQSAPETLLEQILATPRSTASRGRRGRSPRVIAVGFACAMLATGGAFAATDPFGFWQSVAPGTALFAVDPSAHTQGVGLQEIVCQPTAAPTVNCRAQGQGQRYELVDHVRSSISVSRSQLKTAIIDASRQGRISSQAQRRFTADLAAVPDSFLTRLTEAMRFGTYGAGSTVVPPIGVPMWLDCQRIAATIACRDLNGDEHAPVGSSIYAAIPSADWLPASRSADAHAHPASVQVMNAILGGTLSPAESRLLVDLMTPGRAPSESSNTTQPIHP